MRKVRAPWVKRKLQLPAAVRTVRRVINNAGFKLPKLINRRVLDAGTKAKRVAWAEPRLLHLAAHWRRRAWGDAHWWHLPRTAEEVAANQGAAKGPVHIEKLLRPRFPYRHV